MKEQDEEVVGGGNKEGSCYDRRRGRGVGGGGGGGRLAISYILLDHGWKVNLPAICMFASQCSPAHSYEWDHSFSSISYFLPNCH